MTATRWTEYCVSMSSIVDKVRRQAMDLTISERASLAHDLILSLEDPAQTDLGPEQEAEIARRVKAIREGKAKARPAAQVFSDIRSALR